MDKYVRPMSVIADTQPAPPVERMPPVPPRPTVRLPTEFAAISVSHSGRPVPAGSSLQQALLKVDFSPAPPTPLAHKRPNAATAAASAPHSPPAPPAPLATASAGRQAAALPGNGVYALVVDKEAFLREQDGEERTYTSLGKTIGQVNAAIDVVVRLMGAEGDVSSWKLVQRTLASIATNLNQIVDDTRNLQQYNKERADSLNSIVQRAVAHHLGADGTPSNANLAPDRYLFALSSKTTQPYELSEELTLSSNENFGGIATRVNADAVAAVRNAR